MTATATRPALQEVAQPAPVDNLPTARPRGAVAAIVPTTWQEVTAIAGAICRAKMAPKSYCDKAGEPLPDKVAVAIMHGLEVGFTPMAALQSIAVINGMPGLYGDGLLAVVRASGLLEDIKEYDEWDKEGPVTATCEVKRRGEPQWGKTVVARADCQKAGWWGKDGPWKATPHRMMQMRARGWALRDKFADVLRGLRSAEEAEDMIDITPAAAPTVPAEEPKRADFVEQPAEGAVEPAKKTRSRSKKPVPAATNVTDVAEVNETQGVPGATPAADAPITFENYTTARAFFDFSDDWLADPQRTAAQARLWEEHYREKIKEMMTHEFERVREAMAATLDIFHKLTAKEQSE